MRILYILEYYHPHIGGVETLFRSLAESMDVKGHQVTILTNRYDISLPAEESLGHTGRIIRRRYANRYGFTFLSWLSAIQLARQADLIHTTSYNAAIPARVAAWWTGTKSIITFHEVYDEIWSEIPWMSKPAKWLHRLFESWITSLKFDLFVGVSDFTARRLVEAGISKDLVRRVYNGIEYKGLGQKDGSGDVGEIFTYLFFGRVGYAKGLDILIPAYAVLCQREAPISHELTLVLPSERTPLLDRVLQMISDLDLTDRVNIVHDLSFSELNNMIGASDAVVIPSYSEGFCFAAVETMAMGTPIISSGRGALAEVISGRYVEADHQDADSLAAAMRRALSGDWQERPERRFRLRDTVGEYMRLYAEIADGAVTGL